MAHRPCIALLCALLPFGCVAESGDDPELRDGGTYEFDEVVEPEPLVLDGVELLEPEDAPGDASVNPNPSYPPCPACARVRAKTANAVVVEVYLDQDHGFSSLEIGVDQPDIRSLTIATPSTESRLWSIYSLSSTRDISADAPVFVRATYKQRPIDLEIVD